MYRMKVLETWVGGDLKGRAHARLFLCSYSSL